MTSAAVGSRGTASTAASGLLDVAARHALSVTWEELSGEERAATKRLVADSVAVAIAAADSDVVDRLAGALRDGRTTEPAESTVHVFGRDQRPLGDGVLLNCALVRQLDLMDVFWDKDVCHPSENIPVAMSAGEAFRSSGRRVLEAIVAGYDLQVGLCRLISFADMGLHHVSAGGVAAPLLLARLRGLDHPTAVHAAALTAYRTAVMGVLSRGEVSNAKSFSYGLLAVDAIKAMRFAEAGLTGPRQTLDWMMERLARTRVGVEDLEAAMGSSTTAVAIKRYPAQFALQGPVEAAITAGRLRPAEAGPVDAIDSVVVRAPGWTIERTTDAAKFRPRNRETADHSLPVCVAMAVLDGDLSAGSMLADRWSDRDVVALAQRVRVERDEELEKANPGGGPGMVELVLDDGRTFASRVEYPLGDPRRPMSDAQLREKFDALVEPRTGAQRCADLWHALMSLDEAASVAAVMTLASGDG